MAHVLDTPHAQYLQGQRRGLLATVAPNGAPQNKPVGFRYNTELGTLDIAGTDMERSAKFRNVAVHPQVAFTVDDVSDANAGAAGVRFAEIRGEAEQVELEAPPFRGTPRLMSLWRSQAHGARRARQADPIARR
jgi:pyridoxamine 5'-phosphate oxidase family protein